MTERRRFCGRCHTCGHRMTRWPNGEERCKKCMRFMRYHSHGWALHTHNLDDRADECPERCKTMNDELDILPQHQEGEDDAPIPQGIMIGIVKVPKCDERLLEMASALGESHVEERDKISMSAISENGCESEGGS